VKGILVVAVFGLAAASCYGTTLQLDAGPLQPDDAGRDAALPTGGFITADVDGITIRAEMRAVSYWWSGLQQGFIEADAQNADWQWALILRNVAGPAGCVGGYIVLQPVNAAAMAYGTFGSEGACAVDLMAPAANVGDVLGGTFTATLDQMSGPMLKQVTNGSFRVPRIAGKP
jgi:hypothetical protein